ncbi:methionine ABC transporter ATP-binding protein [Fervidibacillus albus]|uniref:Methionine ABC transporter ATP-binding protein n=1 Tax=Fervidibacillus albus TaxID=2980026 RepID=A0A9E8LV78_9BACI|nr:methionine ABC transporter ATP-binding protein [Fervidibacillus albus]WAA09935.1 methionine ABC transporter ATP-binding protein [Fervidibacillus albus]
MISVQNVKKTFRSKSGEITAVKDVNLEIKEGEIFGIIGYSGAGKSTLIRMFNGLEQPTAGSIRIGGKDITTMKGSELRLARQEIGMIFQHFHLLWSRTVRGNISFPLEIAGVPKKKRDERVEELIQLVGLAGKEDAYPSELSGGQKQRVGIARALANNPKVLLCDEATSALDPDTTDAILNLLVDINKRFGLTIILITHEMHVIQKICHRVAVMEKGKIVETGSVLDVFKRPKQSVTKRFLGQVTEAEDMKETIERLLDKYKTGKILKLTFVGEVAEEPIISNLIQNQSILVNIVHGNISQTRSGSYGTLFIHMDGKEEEVHRAIQFLQSRQIGVEVIEHV